MNHAARNAGTFAVTWSVESVQLSGCPHNSDEYSASGALHGRAARQQVGLEPQWQVMRPAEQVQAVCHLLPMPAGCNATSQVVACSADVRDCVAAGKLVLVLPLEFSDRSRPHSRAQTCASETPGTLCLQPPAVSDARSVRQFRRCDRFMSQDAVSFVPRDCSIRDSCRRGNPVTARTI